MRRLSRPALAAALAATVFAAPAFAQEGDPVAGEKAFKKCAACHSIEPGAGSKIGPNLHDVVGRTTGTLPDFKYSDAMAKAGADGHVWTVEEIAIFLENPKKAMPGTKMTFVGLKKPEERANVIAYLVSLNPAGAGAAPAAAPADAAPAPTN
jgi:cytochrome c